MATSLSTDALRSESHSAARVDGKGDAVDRFEMRPIESLDAPVVTADEVKTYSKADDAAMKAMADYDGPPLVLDDETSKRLLRKIDWHIMPILFRS